MRTPKGLLTLGILSLALRQHASAVVFDFTSQLPAGLSPGDNYRVVYVTSLTTTALSTDIDDYNIHAQNDASQSATLNALGSTWKAVGSTSAVDAIDNTASQPDAGDQFPIYTTGGARVANDYTDLWDGSLLAKITDINGNEVNEGVPVWTGTNTAGTEKFTSGNSQALGGFPPMTGFPSAINSDWIEVDGAGGESSFQMYAMSGLVAAVPEPSFYAMVSGLGLLGFAVARRRAQS